MLLSFINKSVEQADGEQEENEVEDELLSWHMKASKVMVTWVQWGEDVLIDIFFGKV